MAVLIGVLTPQYLRYLERAKRQTDVTNAHEIEKCFQLALITYPELGTRIDGGHLTGMVFINPNATPNNPPQNIVDAVHILMGKVPKSQTDRNLWWSFQYHGETGELQYIRLTSNPAQWRGGRPSVVYELYPDPADFLYP